MESRDVLTEILRTGARKLLVEAVETEVTAWIESHAEVTQPRVHDRRPACPRAARRRAGEAERFQSKILPPYLRKSKTIAELIPWLYLKGISTGDMSEALAGLVGAGAAGLSPSVIAQLKSRWEQDYKAWEERSLEGKQYLYVWADGIHFNLQAKDGLHQIWMAAGRAKANEAFDLFLRTYEAKYPKATACLAKDRDVLLTFYDFPAEHWRHIRTTNPIESTFATVRLRTDKTRGCGSRIACLTMVWKLMECAAKSCPPARRARTGRLLNGSELLKGVIQGVKFVDVFRVAA